MKTVIGYYLYNLGAAQYGLDTILEVSSEYGRMCRGYVFR